MTHPVPPITGYRQLSDAEVAQMNKLKALERSYLDAVAEIAAPTPASLAWKLEAIAAVEKATMFACRAVARPNGE